MSTYAAGATVERRYPGATQDGARFGAEAQVQAFLAASWMISSERWVDDTAGGAPIGDAVATGSLSYLVGSGGNLVITYVAARDTELPPMLPAYSGTDPRADNLQTLATFKVVAGIAAAVVFLLAFLSIASQMGHQPGFGPGVVP